MRKFKNKAMALLFGNNSGGAGAGGLLSSSPFLAQLTKSLVLQRGTGSPTFTRTTTRKSGQKYDPNGNLLFTSEINEAVFSGARRVYNVVTGSSENLNNAFWSKGDLTIGAGTASITTENGQSLTLQKIQEAATTAVHYVFVGSGVAMTAGRMTVSYYVAAGERNWCWLYGVTGANATAYFNLATGVVGTVSGTGNPSARILAVTGGYRVQLTCDMPTASNNWGIGSTTGDGVLSSVGTLNSGLYVGGCQCEVVTGHSASHQVAGEYVSVGVLSAPYHGSGVDGVKCFDTDIDGNALAQNYTYDAVSLNGVAGTYVSTPDSVAASVTGDIDIRVKAALADWTPAVGQALFGKWGASGTRSYLFYVAIGGQLQLYTSSDGTTSSAGTSSVATGVSDGAVKWVRATRASSSGAIVFYTSDDGITWAQLGTATTNTSGSIYDSATIPNAGGYNGGTEPLSGKIYRAQIYNGINGTLAVDFDASRYNPVASATTLTGTTGETWTLQGNAKIWPTNGPMLGYNAEPAATNLCLQSQTFGTTWSSPGAVAVVLENQYVAPDGTTTADKLTAAAGNTTHYLFQARTHTAAAHTYSCYVRYVNNRWMSLAMWDGATQYQASFDLLNGIVGGVTASSASTMQRVGTDVYRVSLTATMAASAGGLAVAINSADTGTNAAIPTWNAAGTEAIGLWGAQLETGSVATSYIATTTIAVARNADVLTFPSAGNISGTVGACYAEVSANWTTADIALPHTILGPSASGGIPLYVQNTTAKLSLFDSGAERTGNVYAPSTAAQKVASRWSGSAAITTISGTNSASLGFDGDLNLPANILVGGREIASGYWNGNIKNVRIWQRALSDSELRSITA